MRERVYILPTVTGSLIFLITIVIFIVGALYSNNLAYLMGHLLLALFVSSMVISNSNLKGIVIDFTHIPITMAESIANMQITLHANSNDPRENVRIKIPKHKISSAPQDITNRSRYEIPFSLPKRGKYSIDKITVYSYAPFGLFYCWKNFKPSIDFYIYPKAEHFISTIHSTPSNEKEGKEALSLHQGDELTYLRKFQPGESPFRAHWFSLARGRPLMIRDFNRLHDGPIKIDLAALYTLDFEQRLSQAVFWIHEAIRTHRSIDFVGKGLFSPQRSHELLMYLAQMKEEEV